MGTNPNPETCIELVAMCYELDLRIATLIILWRFESSRGRAVTARCRGAAPLGVPV